MSEQFKRRLSDKTFIGCLVAISSVFFFGCEPTSTVKTTSTKPETSERSSRDISAQGRIMPSAGIVQIGAIPGDRIEEILVDVGQVVEAGTVLVKMRSEQLRSGELEMLRTKLIEAVSAIEAKKADAELAIKAARGKHEQALAAQNQATEQLRLIESQIDESEQSQLATARRQLQVLVSLREDPLTRPMIGAMELDARRAELSKLETTLQSSKLTAEQAVETTGLAVKMAQDAIAAAQKAEEMIETVSPIESLRKQIELLERQIAQARITAPCTGTILSRHGKAGELASVLPILEMADLDKMVCMAEVHEADIGRVKPDDIVILSSAALQKNLRGKVARIDALVGVPQMRSPNPMARTDFRAVPIIIDIDAEQNAVAAKRVQLQTDVTIVKDRP